MLKNKNDLDKEKIYRSIDEALPNPEQVYRLDIYQENKVQLLSELGKFKNLQELDISLVDLSQNLIDLSQFPFLQRLSLQCCNLREFPHSLSKLENIQQLSLGNNSLTEIPSWICEFHKLNYLNLSQNEIKETPEFLFKLSNLETLCLSRNNLKDLSDTISSLKNLKGLFLDCNQLEEITSQIGHLTKLKQLSLNNNKLKTLPISLILLLELEYLNIESNPYEELPKQFKCLNEIKEFIIDRESRSLFMDWSYRFDNTPVKIPIENFCLSAQSFPKLEKKLVKSIKKYGLLEIENEIFKLAKAAIEIQSTKKHTYKKVGLSRFGGFPDLPDDSFYPKYDQKYWSFLCQINLEDIQGLAHFLPNEGLLSFFIDSTESFCGKVLFQNKSDFKFLKTIYIPEGASLVDEDDDYTDSSYQLKFTPNIHLPDYIYNLPNEDLEEKYERIYSHFNSDLEHALNGIVFTQGESANEQAANELGGKPEEWVSLLQLGWDTNVGFCFWDAGVISFLIHQEDLSRLNFSNCFVCLESS